MQSAIEMSGSHRLLIREDTDIVLARQRVRAVASELGFSSTDQTLIATAVSELTRNILTYAQQGELLVRKVAVMDRQGIEIVASDKGPGIADLQAAMRDGYSTGGGLGLGLPGTKRLVDEFEIQSQPAEGTTITIRKWVGG